MIHESIQMRHTQGPPTGGDSPSSAISGRNRENSAPLRVVHLDHYASKPVSSNPAPDNRLSKKKPIGGAKNSGCFATLLDRLEKLQQVGVDLIHVRRGETVRHARIENCLGSLDELGRFLSRNV